MLSLSSLKINLYNLLMGGTSGAALYLDFLYGTLDPRITFTRGSNATLVDATGKITYAPANFLTYSQEFDNAAWTKSAVTVTANSTAAPDGTLTADTLVASATTAAHLIYASTPILTSGTRYTSSFYAKAAGYNYVSVASVANSIVANALFDLSAGVVVATTGTATITPAGNGWYRCSATLAAPTTNADLLGIGLAPTSGGGYIPSFAGDGTSGVFLWGAQLEPVTYQTTPSPYVATTASAYYGPRFDYDPVTLAPKGLLIEEQRTNLLTYSQQFDNVAGWVSSFLTIAANTTVSPDGTSNADTATRNTTSDLSDNSIRAVTTQAVSTAYTFSVYVKANTAGARLFVRNLAVDGSTTTGLVQFNPADGTISLTYGSTYAGKATMTAVGNGWYRCTMTGTTPAVIANNLLDIGVTNGASAFGGVTGNSVFIWGADLEAGSFATSYIPTVASQVTRSADVATMTGTNFSSWFNATQGSFVSDFDKSNTTLRGGVLCAGNTTVGPPTGISLDGQNDGKVRAYIETAGALEFGDLTLANYTANIPIKLAVAYATNNAVGAAAGALGTVDTSVVVPTLNALQIGAIRNSNAAATLPLNGHIRSIAYYNTRLTNTQLQQLTAPSLVTTLSLNFINGVYDACH